MGPKCSCVVPTENIKRGMKSMLVMSPSTVSVLETCLKLTLISPFNLKNILHSNSVFYLSLYW